MKFHNPSPNQEKHNLKKEFLQQLTTTKSMPITSTITPSKTPTRNLRDPLPKSTTFKRTLTVLIRRVVVVIIQIPTMNSPSSKTKTSTKNLGIKCQ